jgi:hypothetical protein
MVMHVKDNANGKSVADLLLTILGDWTMFVRLLLLIMCVGLIVGVMTWIIGLVLPSNASEVQIGAAHILFSQTTKNGEKYVAMVSPQGWERTGIEVPGSSTLKIDADGRVQIDLSGLNKALRARETAENRVMGDRNAGRILAEGNGNEFAPEDYFTESEKRDMRPAWGWVGPNGIPEAAMREHGNAERWRRALMPSAGYGTLIAALDSRDLEPSTSPALMDRLLANAFIVGGVYRQKIDVQRGGFLYFAVNDVRSRDASFPEEFFVDNIGAFYAKVEVSK